MQAGRNFQPEVRHPGIGSRSRMKNASAKNLRRALGNVRIPWLASKERTRTWGTNTAESFFTTETQRHREIYCKHLALKIFSVTLW